LFLAPGRYRITVVAKDVVGGNMTNYEAALDVPRLEDDQISSSSLVLADVLQRLPTRSIGSSDPFTIGANKVRPRLNASFKRDEKMGISLQLYNFQPEDKSQKPDGTVEYTIIKNGSAQPVLEFTQELKELDGSASELRIEKLLPLTN